MLNSAWALALALSLQSAAPPPAPATPARGEDRPFTHLFQNVAHDIRALPSIDTALILTVGSVAALSVHPADDRLAHWAATAGPSGYTRIGRVTGDGWFQGTIAVATYAAGLVGHDARTTHIGSDLIRAQFLNAIITDGTKAIARRTRPNGGHHSFPSGHASAAFATAAVVQGHYGWKASVPAYAMAGFIGWTRMRDDVHWMSDVAVGAAVGILVGQTVTHNHRRLWTVVPAGSAHGVSVTVIRAQR